MDNMDEKAVVQIDPEGMVKKCAKGLTGGECGYKAGAKVCGKCGAMAVQIKGGVRGAGENEDMIDDIEGPEGSMGGDMSEMERMAERAMARKKRRRARMESMGMKSDDMDDDTFVCAFSREVKSAAGSSPCDDCVGGCQVKDGRPDLLEIEGLTEDALNGKVINSGYSEKNDIFVLHVERKDGQFVEAYVTGDGEIDGWFRVDSEEVLGKEEIVDIETATAAALGVIEGKAASTSVSTFEGSEVYAIEIDGLDGKSYDVFVSPDGEVLGYDQYVWEDGDDIDSKSDEDDVETADVDDVEEKRAYSEERRMSMAEAGEALPDGSYPIADEADLRNAIQAYGRAKDKEAAKAHIVKRAEDLELENLIPENWDDEDMEGEKSAHIDEITAAMMEFELLAAEEEIKGLLNED